MSVYFFRRDADGLVKIGFSKHVDSRCAEFRGPNKGRVLAVVEGGFVRERLFHDHFAAERRTGEWFAPSDEMFWVIGEIVVTGDTLAVPAEPPEPVKNGDLLHLRHQLGLSRVAAAGLVRMPVSAFMTDTFEGPTTVAGAVAYLRLRSCAKTGVTA